MPFHVMNADRRDVEGVGEGPAQGRADQQRADQTGALRVRDAAELPRRQSGLIEQTRRLADVVPRGEFRDHPAVIRVQAGLAEEALADDAAIGAVYGHPGFVAGGFDAEHGTEAEVNRVANHAPDP